MGIFNNTATAFDVESFTDSVRRDQETERIEDERSQAGTLSHWSRGYVRGSHGSDQWVYVPEVAASHMRWVQERGIVK